MPHPDPVGPPRRRANKVRGHGTWGNDRPSVCGVVGREGGHVRLTVAARSDGATLRKVVRKASWPMTTINTDEWRGYDGLPGTGGLRNFLRPFRGVSKKYPYQYVALFEWGCNVERATLGFLRALLGVESATGCPT